MRVCAMVACVWAATVSVQRDLLGAGLRRELRTSLLLDQDCEVVVHETVTPDWFIDSDEVASDSRLSFHSFIDIELPKSLSNTHFLTVAGQSFQGKFEYQIPVHLRYNDCSETREYIEVPFPPPEVLLWCENSEKKGTFGSQLLAKMPVGRRSHLEIVTYGTFTVVLVGLSGVVLSLVSYSRAKTKKE